MRTSWRLTLAVSVALLGCASGGTGLNNKQIDPGARSVMANVIGSQEIAKQNFNNAWQAVLALRPNWDRTLAVYMNDRPFGNFDRLQNIGVDSVQEIRNVSREEARARWDINAQAAILVLTKPKKK